MYNKRLIRQPIRMYIAAPCTRVNRVSKECNVVIAKSYGVYWLSLILVIVAAGCGDDVVTKGFDHSPISFPDTCQAFDFSIDSVVYEDLPFTGISEKVASDTAFPMDYEGVPMSQFGLRHYYHPVNLFQRCFALLDIYRRTDNRDYLETAERYINRLWKESMQFDSAAYFPYRRDYYVNQQEEGFLPSPWFSGMAQGEGLGVMTRAFILTGDSTYLDYAHRIFKSFLRLRGEAEPWTVFICDRGCYWVEEYPTAEPSMTLNGFIFAIYGLYDYFQLTKSEEAEEILKRSLSTIKNYLPSFRRPGRPSYYGLTFGHFAADYHRIHIGQLRDLEKFTNDPFFGAWADTLKADYFD